MHDDNVVPSGPRLGRPVGGDARLLPRVRRSGFFGRRSVIVVASRVHAVGRSLSPAERQSARETHEYRRVSDLQRFRHRHVPVGMIRVALESHSPRAVETALEVDSLEFAVAFCILQRN